MSRQFLGIDIGGTKCAVSLLQESLGVIDKIQFPTNAQAPAENTIDQIGKYVEELKGRHRGKIDPCAVGVSVGAMFNSANGQVYQAPHLPLWKNVPVVTLLEHTLNLPVYAENDANACALAEWKYGAGKGCQHLAFLTFGTGLGAGLILNGQLYRGVNSLAGEIGGLRVAETGPPIRQQPGCLEGFASGAGIALLAEEIMRQENWETTLPENPTTKEIADQAQQGDPLSLQIFSRSGYQLGIGLAMTINLLNLEKIILGSVFLRCEQFLRPSMLEAMKRDLMPEAFSACEIVSAQLGEQIGDYAALAVAEQSRSDDSK